VKSTAEFDRNPNFLHHPIELAIVHHEKAQLRNLVRVAPFRGEHELNLLVNVEN
jgi:hypothetical protein